MFRIPALWKCLHDCYRKIGYFPIPLSIIKHVPTSVFMLSASAGAPGLHILSRVSKMSLAASIWLPASRESDPMSRLRSNDRSAQSWECHKDRLQTKIIPVWSVLEQDRSNNLQVLTAFLEPGFVTSCCNQRALEIAENRFCDDSESTDLTNCDVCGILVLRSLC
jgi:hypothetical protein